MRNSILLVDFINLRLRRGRRLPAGGDRRGRHARQADRADRGWRRCSAPSSSSTTRSSTAWRSRCSFGIFVSTAADAGGDPGPVLRRQLPAERSRRPTAPQPSDPLQPPPRSARSRS
ncbi:MAG: hypothetical protein MZW92_43445 [Comamonadaceae bacterium]|nr:hypothetical protein [Comamonadaceae bacterium]